MNFEITNPGIEDYCEAFTTPPSAALKALIPATKDHAPQVAHMQVGPIEGKFLSMVAALMGAKTVLEFGTFTGYSSLAFAEILPADGRVTTLDRDPKATELARQYWEKAGVSGKVELLLGDARESVKVLESEIASGKRPQFDLAFIDADKAGYPLYWESSLKLVRKGGAILVDNVLWSGGVLKPEDASDFTMVKFNELVKQDQRVEKVLLPIRDGIYLARVL